MYLYHYGLKELPFTLTPNTRFYCEVGTFSEAITLVHSAINCGEGFIKIVGEVGTGKTLLCQKLLKRLQKKYEVFHIADPIVSPLQFKSCLLQQLKQTNPELASSEDRDLAHYLRYSYDKGRSVVILVDEAQAIPRETLECIRLLTNIESESHKYVQVVLLGQPELDKRLNQDGLRQLKQRITFSYYLNTLNTKEVERYINHRLNRAEFIGRPEFSMAAIRAIARYSRGVPRLINIICHHALLIGFGKDKKIIDRDIILEAKRAHLSRKNNGKFWPIWVLLSSILLSAGLWLVL